MIKKIWIIFFLVLIFLSISSIQASNETISENIDTEEFIVRNEINQDEIQRIIDTNINSDGVISGKKDLNISLVNVSVEEKNATVSFVVSDNATGNMSLFLKNYLNGEIVNSNSFLNNSTLEFTFNNLSSGVYEYFLLSYTGDSFYNSFNINTFNDKLIRYYNYYLFDIKDSNSNITVENMISYVNNYLVIKVVDSSGQAVKKVNYGFESAIIYIGRPIPFNYYKNAVQITINGVSYIRELNNDGCVYLNINLNPGEYDLDIQYNGNRIYSDTNTSTNLTVLPSFSGEDLTKYYKSNSPYEVKILDREGNGISSANVRMNVNGVTYYRVTDSEGIVRLNINLNPGAYTITVYHSFTNLPFNRTINILPTLIGEDINKSFIEKSQYKVKVLDNNGNEIVGANVLINIHGIIYTKITDNDGIAKLDINLNPGSYIVTATWNNYSTSNNIKVE